MERDCKRKKRENFEKRSPLQNLNGLPLDKRCSKKSLKLSSSSSSSSAPAFSSEAPKHCSRFLLSSNSCSSSSSSSSCSRINLDKKLKTFSKIPKNEQNKPTAGTSKVLSRSKENEISRKPLLQKSEKKQPQSLSRSEYGKNNANPIYRNGRRSKLSSTQSNPENKLKKGSQEYQQKTKISLENGPGEQAFELLGVSNDTNLNCAENCTPVGRVESLNFGDRRTVIEDEKANGNSGPDVKTPPVEASQSPEIQCQSHSKMLVLKSAATPVCYGAGHLVSGITDKRKCRRRGSLRGGPQKTNLFDDERSDEDVIDDLKESSIPLLAEASVRWHLSPCNEGHEDRGIDSRNRLVQCRMACDDASGTLDLLPSHSMLCGNESDLLCAESKYSGSDGVRNVANKRRYRNVKPSPIKATEFQGLLEPMVEYLLSTSPNAGYSVNGISSNEGKHFSENLIRADSKLSIGSLNIGNIIQTPDSDSSSDVCVGRSRLEALRSNFVGPEVDLITETLGRVNLSPRSELSMWDQPGLGFKFADTASPPVSVDAAQLQKNVDSISSWVSDTTYGSLSLSQMRISWRDGLASGTVDTDEFDCCCLLSDEEIDADESASEQLMFHPLTEAAEDKANYQGTKSCQKTYLGFESGENKENALRTGNDISPALLDYEPCISAWGKEKSSSHRTNACAESICTDGGGLVASDDSDWTYFHENGSFQVK